MSCRSREQSKPTPLTKPNTARTTCEVERCALRRGHLATRDSPCEPEAQLLRQMSSVFCHGLCAAPIPARTNKEFPALRWRRRAGWLHKADHQSSSYSLPACPSQLPDHAHAVAITAVPGWSSHRVPSLCLSAPAHASRSSHAHRNYASVAISSITSSYKLIAALLFSTLSYT